MSTRLRIAGGGGGAKERKKEKKMGVGENQMGGEPRSSLVVEGGEIKGSLGPGSAVGEEGKKQTAKISTSKAGRAVELISLRSPIFFAV